MHTTQLQHLRVIACVRHCGGVDAEQVIVFADEFLAGDRGADDRHARLVHLGQHGRGHGTGKGSHHHIHIGVHQSAGGFHGLHGILSIVLYQQLDGAAEDAASSIALFDGQHQTIATAFTHIRAAVGQAAYEAHPYGSFRTAPHHRQRCQQRQPPVLFHSTHPLAYITVE